MKEKSNIAKDQSVPIVAIGDFNFDYNFATQQGNKAFQIFTAEGSPWTWVKPEPLTDTNWFDGDDDGKDNYPDSCLDFTFVARYKRHNRETCYRRHEKRDGRD